MIRFGFYMEIILQGEKKNLDDDLIFAVLKNWQQDLKTQVFKNEEVRIKVSKIEETELPENDNQTLKDDDPWRQVADPLLVTHKTTG